MALFQFGKKDSAKEPSAPRTEPGAAARTPAAAGRPAAAADQSQIKDLLRLIAIDASRKVDLEKAVRALEIVSASKGFILLVKLQDHVNLTDAQLVNRLQAFERRATLVTHSRGVTLLDVYWCMPLSLLEEQAEHGDAPMTQFAVSQMGDFSPSQYGGTGAQSAFYPDDSLVQWNAQDLPQTGEVRKAHSAETRPAPPDF